MAFPSGSSAIPQGAREGSLEQAIEQFDPALARLNEHRQALGHLLDRVFGPHPTPVDGKTEQAPAPSMIANLNARCRYLETLVNDIGDLLKRLDEVL